MTTLPTNVSVGRIVGTFLIPDGTGEAIPATGWVRFTPCPGWLLDSDSEPPATLVSEPILVPLGDDGSIDVTLVATDDVDLNPVAWSYRVELLFNVGEDRTFSITVPGGSVQDLTTIQPVAHTCGEAIVRGPAGPPGVDGAPGPAGPPGPPADTTALEAQLDALEARVAALEASGGGDSGGGVSVTSTWQANPQPGAVPGGRQFTMETGELATSTWLRFDPRNKDNADMTAALVTASAFFVQQASDATNWARLNVAGEAVVGNYIQVPVEFINAGGEQSSAQWQNALFVIYAKV